MAEVVSNESDLIVLVDSEDREIGLGDKYSCHTGAGVLHRALSVFLFDAHGRVLLQKRSSNKLLWPEYWSNSCCTHPYYGESIEDGAQRRIEQELGLSEVALEFVYRFEYHAAWNDQFAEHELCSVFVGQVASDPIVNKTEICDWKWVEPDAMEEMVASANRQLTPWLKLEWPEVRNRTS